MPRLTLTVGVLLTVIGLIAYLATGAVSVTALIPAFVGVPIVICGVLARQDGLRKIVVHIALVIALLGALGSLMNVVKIGQLFAGTAERPSAIITSVLLFVITACYVVIGVRSFVNARRSRAS